MLVAGIACSMLLAAPNKRNGSPWNQCLVTGRLVTLTNCISVGGFRVLEGNRYNLPGLQLNERRGEVVSILHVPRARLPRYNDWLRVSARSPTPLLFLRPGPCRHPAPQLVINIQHSVWFSSTSSSYCSSYVHRPSWSLDAIWESSVAHSFH